MQNTDYLNLKTTNINVRISPILKSQLIERGANLGVNLSDYIGHVLTKDMSGQNDPKQSDDYKQLLQKSQRVQAELQRYQALTEPFKNYIGVEFPVDGKNQRFEHPVDLLTYFLKTIKIKG